MDFKKALSNLDLVYPDGIAKGFPLWCEKGIEMQHITINAFLEIFADENIEINYPKQIRTIEEFSSQYKDRIEKYDTTLPVFVDDNEMKLFITDNLPYNLKRMDKEKIESLLTYYYVLRLLNSKQIPMSRDYYISPLLQFNIAVSNMSKQEAIDLMNSKLKLFCKKINLPTLILEYNGVENYSEKVYMVAALNQKLETQTIIQSSLLSNELLKKFDISEELKNKYVFDIGYSQKIFAYLACNNMDLYGMRLPSIYKSKDIAIIYNSNIESDIINKLKNDEEILSKVYFDNRLGKKKLKTIKNEYINKGVRVIIVQNHVNNKDIFLVYDISQKMRKIFTIEEIYNIIENIEIKLDDFYYTKMNEKLEKHKTNEYAYVSEFKDKGKIVN